LSATATFVSAQKEGAGLQWLTKELYFFATERSCWPTMAKEGAFSALSCVYRWSERLPLFGCL